MRVPSRPPPPLSGRFRALRLLRAAAVATVLGGAACGAEAQPPLTLGILPAEGPLETRNDWSPFAAGIAQALGVPTRLAAATSYDAMADALRHGTIDLAVLSGSLAVEAVSRHGMTVIARALPADPARHRAVLVSRRGAAPATLVQMLMRPGYWKLARGDTRSLSGYLVPQLRFFLPRGLRMEAFFFAEVPGSPQTNMLAVANGEVDVGLTTGSELARFKERFPNEYSRIAALWQSDPLPAALVVARRALPEPVRARLVTHLAGLGRTSAGQEELRRRHALAGFEPAGDAGLLAHAHLVYSFDSQSALQGRWTDEAARRTRLLRIEEEYAALRATLGDQRIPKGYVMPAANQSP